MARSMRVSIHRFGLAACLCAFALTGCVGGPGQLPDDMQKPIDRSIVEYPTGVQLTQFAKGLTAPVAIAFDNEEGEHKGTIFVAESGIGGHRPRVYGFDPYGSFLEVYPRGKLAQLPFDLPHGSFAFAGPIGGMVFSGGKLFVTHRDAEGNGVVTAFNPYDGTHFTVVADLPAQGDFGMTSIAVQPGGQRLYFGVGAATNSGVVGLDNWEWVKQYPKACDIPYQEIKLNGFRFDTHNPLAGLFGPDATAVTVPFQPFGLGKLLRIPGASNGKPTGAIYSVSTSGGDLRVEATGLRNPRGFTFDEYDHLFFTDNGMEMRGTRPVKEDPDVFYKLYQRTWYGFPDFSRDLVPISETRFQPPPEVLSRTSYPELSALIDLNSSNLTSPASARDTLLRATLPPLSGAAGADLIPKFGDFKELSGKAIIAESGDRAPWATGGAPLMGPVGYKLVIVDPDQSNGPVSDFVRNTQNLPAHLIHNDQAMERPIDVKLGPDGAIYILDFGEMRAENGKFKVPNHGGRIFRLGSPRPPTSRPATDAGKPIDYREYTR